MQYSALLPKLAAYKRIIVTGPQRSGTSIATKIIASNLGLEYVHERKFGIDKVHDFFTFLDANARFVVHAPAMSSVVHYVRDCAVVFMRRPFVEIHASETRIGWQERFRKLEYQRYFCPGGPQEPLSIAELKYAAWEQIQKPALCERAFELDYSSLASHPLWVDKEERATFTNWQTAKDEEAPMDYRI